eukprot:NODE_3403_length_933_cov_8.463801_g749_i2.p2 GENE.NODE_3403_length_933_cov_8.463801_g749_i2~~NODE_3403_length_933_cov_8.463801_g749_i2.p2  ORF type:complete len:269 (+),score=59.22 NODE_3403_length_933_cov_8.463801_g749_i2:51-809(+)
MADFWYGVIRPAFPNARLVYTDTDSFIIYLEWPKEAGNAVVDKFLADKALPWDFSGLPQEHRLYPADVEWREAHRKQPGWFSLETEKDITEVAARDKKYYAVRLADDSEKARAKGVPGAHLPGFEQQLSAIVDGPELFDREAPENLATIYSLRGHNVNMYLEKSTKRLINEAAAVRSRELIADGLDSIAFGHPDPMTFKERVTWKRSPGGTKRRRYSFQQDLLDQREKRRAAKKQREEEASLEEEEDMMAMD